ncbi:hypothetical protein OG512_47275 [Streptomyces sp. NBC_01378]|uniref:Uncharacterized protein n=1 Tax=Streptomyces sp. NBC_00119 TaxID=2975659 RepID=A0AAU1TZ34_9ACTN
MSTSNGSAKNSGNGTARKAPAKRATSTSERAQSKATAAANKAETAVADAEEAASTSVRSGSEAARSASHAMASGLQMGQQAVTVNAAKAATAATAAWTVVKNRKLIAAGAAASIVGIAGAGFAVGRATAKPPVGPLTRLAGGRI